MGDITNTQVVIAGAVAAFTVDILVYPLDTIKIRYQSQDLRNVLAETASASASVRGKGKGKQAHGRFFRGLYQGIGSVIFATLPAAGLFFITYEAAKPAIRSGMPSATPKPLVHALASASAELASCLVLAPAEAIKQNAQMITQSTGSPGNLHQSASIRALRMVWRGSAGPVRSLWTGYTVLAARNLPFTCIHFPLFEFVRAQVWARRGRCPGGTDRPAVIETGLVTGASAASSGALAALIITPADVVKTQVMLSAGEPEGRNGGGGRENTKGLNLAKEIIGKKGIRGIFRGAMLRASWAGLGGGLYLGSYEAAKVSLQGAEKASRPDDGF